jgi:hypothetical protein
MPVTKRQIRLLAPYLEGEQPTHINIDGTREWNLKCPLHDDEKRSASLNIEKGVFYCFRCGGMPITALIRRMSEWRETDGHSNGDPDLNGQPTPKPTRLLNEGMIAGWHSALLSNESALQWLLERRGITLETVRTYEIGMEDKKHYTIPVRSVDGEILNVRYYNPTPGTGRKIWGERGYNSPPQLYPLAKLNAGLDKYIIAAGEWDTLRTLQAGYNCVTRTAGENVWHTEWNEWFKGKTVYVCQDRDEEGQAGARKIARALSVMADVRLVELPYELVKKHGKDLTDFFLEHEESELQTYLDAAQPYARGKPVPELQTISVLDTFDSKRIGKPVRVMVTIRGRKEPGYSVPQVIRLACTQDAGNKCHSCPLNGLNGETEINVASDNPMVLSMIESSINTLNQVIAESFGIPGGRCTKLQFEHLEHQAVEVLYGRPALDYTDGSERGPSAAAYKNITITSVGRYDTAPNNTVSVIGALHPNPRTHNNEFLASELTQMETSVDRFDLDAKTIKMLRRFQPSSIQTPLKKVAEISRALASHVTHIHGRPEMHALMDLTFHSLLSFNFAGELVARGWLESLIIGDTRTGKSLAAERLVRHFGGGEIISCEAASFAGVVGGVQQLNGREWAITWGVVPLNDRRLVVMDEISGLTPEQIGQMSDIRSSGQAKLTKIQQETTWARTRLLWLGNPRNATMANYTYGVDAIKPLIGNAEDIARFDLAMAATLYDVPAETINQPASGGELRYTEEACHNMLMWTWTRTADQVRFYKPAEEQIFNAANEMGKMYIEDPPLVQAANIRIKIARVAAALAARTFSTDAKGESVIVTPAHVKDAVAFMNLIYNMPAFGYRERSKEMLSDRSEAENNKDKIREYLLGRKLLAKHLRNAGKFRRQDLEELLNISRDEANAIINTLYEARMIRRVLGDIYVEPTLHALLREVKL